MKEAHQAVKKGLVGGVGRAEGETSPRGYAMTFVFLIAFLRRL